MHECDPRDKDKNRGSYKVGRRTNFVRLKRGIAATTRDDDMTNEGKVAVGRTTPTIFPQMIA